MFLLVQDEFKENSIKYEFDVRIENPVFSKNENIATVNVSIVNKKYPDKGIGKKLYDNIIKDVLTKKKINKELVVVRNSADEGNTIVKSLADGTNNIHLDRITIISLGGIVV